MIGAKELYSAEVKVEKATSYSNPFSMSKLKLVKLRSKIKTDIAVKLIPTTLIITLRPTDMLI